MPYPIIYPHSYPGMSETDAQPKEPGVKRIWMNKRTEQLRYESETEDSVVIVIEPKGTNEKTK